MTAYDIKIPCECGRDIRVRVTIRAGRPQFAAEAHDCPRRQETK